MGDSIRVLSVGVDFADRIGDTSEAVDSRLDVRATDSVPAALEAVAETDVDCLVSGHDPPEMDGIALLEAIRETHPSLPFVLCPDDGSEALASEAISAGVTEYVHANDEADRCESIARRVIAAVGCENRRTRPFVGRLEDFVEHSPDMIDVHDAEGTILDVNRRFCEALGQSREELVGRKIWEVDRSLDPDEIRATLAEMNVGDRRHVETRFERDDGSSFPAEVHVAKLRGADDDRFVVITRDITERKRRQRELIELENALEIVLEHVPVVFFAFDDEGVFTRSQGRALERVGLEPGEAVGESVFDLYADVPAILEHSERALAGEPVSTVVEVREATFESWYQPIFEGEAVTGVVGLSYDVTEREERREQLQRQNTRLDEFTSIVSHDLRNPLNVASGALELLRDGDSNEEVTGTDAPTDADRAISIASNAHDRMDRLITDLLSLAREGERVTEDEPVSLEAAARRCWQHVETSKATLDIETTQTVRADGGRLEQLLENLVSNAVEHGSTSPRSQTPEDAVEHGSTSHAEPDSSADAIDHGGDDVTVTIGDLEDGFYVADDGPGIDEDDRERVFEWGYTSSREGTGLGLSIVEEIVTAHGWTIELCEGVDGGARFEITGVEILER
ncbi:PAS domain S-box protein [Natrialba sp. INN-245]|uniref:sensor histidine kinase n=1 Tax=Natrialba sp. INN-245 TaxID=2690967 RepID=UPI00131012FE|nr:PAS domain S-box protein [Natrialba sp. INN-245]MWV40598.1 PAS domain S-box protein [Natrialba sp. INN-245]